MELKSSHLIACLEELGINIAGITERHLDWRLQNSGVAELVDYFCGNVNSCDNVLSADELRQYDELQKQGLILYGDELDEAILGLEKHYPDILELDEDDIAILTEKKEDQEMHLQELLNLENKCRDNTSALKLELDTLKNESVALEIELESAADESSVISEQLDNADKSLLCLLEELRITCNNFPINEFLHLMESVKQNFKVIQNCYMMYVNQAFEKPRLHSMFSSDCLLTNLSRIKVGLVSSLKAKYLAETEAKYLDTMLSTIKTIQRPSSSELQYEMEIIQCQTHVDSLNMQIEELSQDLLNLTTQQWADSEVMKVVQSYVLVKLSRRMKNRDKLITLQNHVLTGRNLERFLWIFLDTEAERLVDIQKLLKDGSLQVQTAQNDTLCHVDRMNSIIENIQKENDNFCIPVLQCLNKLLGVRNDHNVSDELLRCLDELAKDVRQKQSVDVFACIEKSHKNVQSVAKSQQIFKKFFMSGPSRSPILYDLDVMNELFQLHSTFNIIENKFKVICDQYQKEQETMKNDKWIRYKHFLWVWFLIQPKKVLKIINELETTLVQTSLLTLGKPIK